MSYVRCRKCLRLLDHKTMQTGTCKCGYREMIGVETLTLFEKFKIKFMKYNPVIPDERPQKQSDMQGRAL